MPVRRRPKGNTQGGQFAAGSRPDEQTLETSLTLQEDAPDDPREFFDWLAYEAGVGPEVELIAMQRTEALERRTGPSGSNRNWKRYREASNQLFEMVAACYEAGGASEQHARIALRKHGISIRRVSESGRFLGRPRGVIPDPLGLRHLDECRAWASGDSRSGLSLSWISQ